MAYKFQLGTARMSGALEQEGAVTVDTGSNGLIAVVPQMGSTQYFAQLKYDNVTEGGFFQLASASADTIFEVGAFLSGTVMDTLAGTALDFDQNTGEMNVNIDGLSALGGTGLHQTQDHFIFSDNGTEKKITFSNLEDAIFANISGDASVAAGGALTIANGAVDNIMLANSGFHVSGGATSVTAGEELALGSTINFIGTANEVDVAYSAGSNTFTFGLPNDVTIAGNLTVQGTQTIIDSATFVVTSSVFFEGTTPDGNEIELTTADASADRTITLPDLDGHVPLIAGAISNANVTAAEFLLLDGNSSIGTTAVAAGHGILMNHGGTMAQTSVATLATYIGNNSSETVQTLTAASQTLSVTAGPVVLANRAAAMTITLDTPANHEGKRVVIKKIGNGDVTISPNGSENIDGQPDDIILESPQAAVTIVSDGSNYFIV